MTDNVYVNTYQLYLWEEQVTASSSQCVSSESNYPEFVPVRTVHTCIIMCLLTFPKQIYKTQKSRSCLQRTICLTLPQILHWEHLHQAETVKQNHTKSVHRYEEKKITQRQSNKTKQKFCRGQSLLGQVLPTMVYGLMKVEARAAAILCPLLAALLSLCNTT